MNNEMHKLEMRFSKATSMQIPRCTHMMRLWCLFEYLSLWVYSWDGPAQPVHILINRHVPAVKCVAQTDLKATLFPVTTDQMLWS